MTMLIILLLLSLFSSVYSTNFIAGTSIRGVVSTATLPQLTNLHINHIRLYLNWKALEPTLEDPLDTSTVAQLRANTSWIQPFITKVGSNWQAMDDQINLLLNSTNINVILEIGEGTAHVMPTYNGVLVSPAVLGKERYLALIYKYCRASVRRYKNRVKIWQIENELNEAYFEAITGVRIPSTLLDNPWSDWNFLTDLLTTLNWAVKDEDSCLLTTQNVHTDIPQSIHEYFDIPGFYLDAINDWNHLMDIISFDSYPNYVLGVPVNAQVLGNKTQLIRQLCSQSSLSHNKPVIVMETGYSVAANASTLPPQVQYTEANQAAFFEQAYHSIVNAGGSGLVIFGTWPNPGFTPPPGGYTSDDIEAMEKIDYVLQTGDILPLLEWLLDPANWAELERVAGVISVIEGGWGILNADGTPKQAYTTLANLFKHC